MDILVNLIVILIIAALVGSSAAYIIKAKKRGVKCIGCGSGGNCPGCSGSCGGSTEDGTCHCSQNK